MIYKYDPPVTDDDIYNYEKYFTCDEDDYMCKFNQNSSCQIVLKNCWSSYSDDDCKKLSTVCDSIDSGIIPNFKDIEVNVSNVSQEVTSEDTNNEETVESIKTEDGYVIPDSLLTYLNCPIGNSICKNSKGSACTSSYSICGSNPETLSQTFESFRIETGNLTPEEYCKIHYSVCNMIIDYNPPLTDDYIYDLDRYLTCNDGDSLCQFGQESSCNTVLSLCWGNYSDSDCNKLASTCEKIYSKKTTTKINASTKNNKVHTIKKTIVKRRS
ncbi:hypothetical protein BCR36DRAFT_586187 [Piromyces finnis]|uniref:Uncharacterized protein n=1 Tax=Piromyces finnis TaxID=1754191 RepID=A0A1Y1V091_9FUNG|nr:hypothetical protein BCR36DRAFT_586187 [Piromyces finnis]|eukprot:ORX44326.1 hypothetical protein BCR36DRAFT_586187 [Piromyces finnis]